MDSLLNKERATEIMARESIDGLIARLPVNRYYVSNYAGASAVAQVDDNGGYWVVLPRDPQAPAALIVPESELQDLAAEQERGRGTWIDNVCSYGDTLHDTASGDVAGTLIPALKSAGLDAAHCATDDPRTAGWLTAHGSERVRMSYRPELFNEIRLVKSAAEIESLKQAAHANEMGLLLAFDSMAAASTPEELENFYMMTMAQQGGRGVQLHVAQGGPAVAAVGSHHPVSLAALGTWRHYHASIGRTAAVGEPDRAHRKTHAHLLAGWETASEQLQPGVSYREVSQAIGATVRSAGLKNFCDPRVHSIGLEPVDDPRPFGAAPRMLQETDVTLEPDMVVTVAMFHDLSHDMSHAETGVGAFRLEDTVRITTYGHERLSKSDFTMLVSDTTA